MLKDVKGLTRTEGGSGVGLSSVRVGVRGGVANWECGGGPGYYGRGLHSSTHGWSPSHRSAVLKGETERYEGGCC